MSKRERVVFLLDHWQDVFDPDGTTQTKGNPDSASEGGVALLPRMSRHPSVLELTRCLGLCRRMAPTHYQHLCLFYGCEWRIVRVPKTVKRGGKVVRLLNADKSPVEVSHRARVLPVWLQRVPVDPETGEPRTVARAVDFCSTMFSGEVFIPSDLLQVAA